MLETVDGHSFRSDLLSGMPILDVGARGFRFSQWFAERGHDVVAMDPGSDVREFPGVSLVRAALTAPTYSGKQLPLVLTDDPEARYVAFGDTDKPTATVPCLDIEAIMDMHHIVYWDVVKLNCEGAESDILQHWPGPIAHQIVASFHLHTGRQTREEIGACVKHLSRWYDIERHIEDERYCAGKNYWDSVFTLKGIK